jgi:sulfotransferase
MDNGIHFISGLPRSGSTLLSAILKQNPRVHAGMTSPVGSLVASLLRQMSQDNEASVFIDDDKRKAILRSSFMAFYHQDHHDKVVFDTNRMWCSKMPLLMELFPRAKVIACVRHVPWVIDSIERIIRQNKFEPSKIFGFEVGGTVYTRFDALGTSHGMVGFPYQALKEAFYGEESDRLMLLTYETLTANPKRAIREVYDFIGEPGFEHDFENVEYNADEFDARLGTPGLHTVGRQVKASKRQTLLPPDLFHRMENDSFWLDQKLNIRNVKIV